VTELITRVTVQRSDNVFKVKWEKHDIWLINFFLCCDSINKGKRTALLPLLPPLPLLPLLPGGKGELRGAFLQGLCFLHAVSLDSKRFCRIQQI